MGTGNILIHGEGIFLLCSRFNTPRLETKMKNIEVGSWEAYCSKVKELEHKYKNVPVLFRGQSNASWHLKTTLERFSKSRWTIKKYCKLVIDCVRGLGPIDDYKGNIPSLVDIDRELSDNMNHVLVHIPASISFYWTYLRHHGFPSPLLDWTKSPYIAAFFAFCDCAGRAKKVAIFAFIDSMNGSKFIWTGKPQITSQWLNIHKHLRHTCQQSCYTIATKAIENDHQFAGHEKVIQENEINQDILIKLLIPSTESMKAMKWLDEKGINYYSLIHDREAQLKSLAFKKIRLMGL